jgi:heme O synthase-like polyprenyltransferase
MVKNFKINIHIFDLSMIIFMWTPLHTNTCNLIHKQIYKVITEYKRGLLNIYNSL